MPSPFERKPARRTGISAPALFGVYVLVLGTVGLLDKLFPHAVAEILYAVFSVHREGLASQYVRYRMSLFVAASVLLVLVVPVLAHRGGEGQSVERVRQMPWLIFLAVGLFSPVAWVSYPLIALCTTCWTRSDIFYFFLTAFFFVALQIFFHAILLKIRIRTQGMK